MIMPRRALQWKVSRTRGARVGLAITQPPRRDERGRAPPEALSGRELESSRCADLWTLLDTQLVPQRPDPEFKGSEGICFYLEFCVKATSKPECKVFDGGWAAERLRAAAEALLREVARPRPVPSAGERPVPAQSHWAPGPRSPRVGHQTR